MNKLIFRIFLLLSGAAMLFGTASCIEDGFTASPSDQPEFPADTLDLGDRKSVM